MAWQDAKDAVANPSTARTSAERTMNRPKAGAEKSFTYA